MPTGAFSDGRVAIVMPVYEEASSITETVAEIYDTIVKNHRAKIFLFEDGSRDGTKDVLFKLQQRFPKLEVSLSPERKGYPRAAAEALLAIDPEAFPLVLFMDSDGQYDPVDFEALWTTMGSQEVDIVQGRRLQRVEPIYRRLPSRTLRFLQKILFNSECRDITSAFRLMKTPVAQRIAAKVKHSEYNFWLEFNARVISEGFRTVEVPVKYRHRDGDSKVYILRRMPKILWSETRGLMLTWLEYRWKELLKFSMVGFSGAMVILAGTWLLVNLAHVHYLLAAALAIELSILWAFGLNDRWTFQMNRKRRSTLARALIYNTVSLAGLGINLTVLFLMTHFWGFFYLFSEALAILVAFSFNYLTNLSFTWGRTGPFQHAQTKLP